MLTSPDVTETENPSTLSTGGNRTRLVGILAAGLISALSYAALTATGDLTALVPVFLGCHLALAALMVAGWLLVRAGGDRELRIALGVALLFRLVASLGEPALSDDIYRYVWDGRVQIQGIHPYRYAPDDPARGSARSTRTRRSGTPLPWTRRSARRQGAGCEKR